LLVFGQTKLKKLTVFAISVSETILILVGLIEHFARVESAIVTLLKLDGIRATFFCGAKKFPGRFHITLVIVAYLGNHIAIAVLADFLTVNY
jgi:hypothetical protein